MIVGPHVPLALLGCAGLIGCSGVFIAAPAPAPAPAVRATSVPQAASHCAALARFALPQVRITEASLIAAASVRAKEPGSNREVGEPLPEHCLVRGRIDERIGADGKPYHTGFELRLPSQFSGRFFYQGGGGNDGQINNAVGRNTGALGWGDNALSRGFAVVTTDAGHQSPAPDFGLDPQARTEHAYRAHERTAATAKAILATYYGREADRSYFVGCSGGGRQGMMFTQRFPGVFDGVIAQAPAMRVSEGATIAAAWTVQKFMAVAPAGADGQPVLARALSELQLKRVAREVLQRCDALDGLKDGLVQDHANCRIDPAELQCPIGASTARDGRAGGAGDGAAAGGNATASAGADEGCLQPAQANALGEVMAGPRAGRGALYFGWPWDPGIADAGWRAWTLGTAQQGAPNARHVTLMAGALGYEFVTPPDPSLSTLNFDFERDPPRMQAFHREYDTADDVQLTGYRQRGGKLMLIHGLADPIFSALETVDYQQRLNAAHGPAQAARFARSFLVPGMTHCSGGPATDAFDGLTALVRWVEQDQAPESILARGTVALPGVSRPLCAHPKLARYRSGDVSSADSFECR